MPSAGATIGSNAKLRSQYKTLYKVAKKLKALSQADDAQAYSDALTWSRALPECILDIVSHSTADELSEQRTNCNLCESLYCAVSQGLQHLATGWDELGTAAEHSADGSGALRSLCILCQELVTVSNAVERACGDTRVNHAAIASKTGLLQNMRPVLCKLLPALEPLQYSATTEDVAAQQQQLISAEQSVHVSLAASLLQMWAILLIMWPGSRFKSSELSATFQPAASLALALMRIPTSAARSAQSAGIVGAGSADLGDKKSPEHECTGDHNNSNSSNGYCISQSPGLNESGPRQRDWCSVGLFLSHTITVAVHEQLNIESVDDYRELSQDFQNIVLSGGVQQLMLVSLAAAAAAAGRVGSIKGTQHETQDRGSTTSGYKSLLLLIGLQPDCLQGSLAVFDSVLQLFGENFDMCYLLSAFTCTFSVQIQMQQILLLDQQQQHKAVDRAAACSGSSSALELQHHNTSSAAAPHLHQLAWPLLLTLKDLAMLLPDGQYEQVLGVLLPCSFLAGKQSTAGVRWLDTAQQQQVLQWLLQPLYLRVAAAVNKLQCHTAAAAATTAAGKAAPSQQFPKLVESWWSVTSDCLHQADCAEGLCLSQLIPLDGISHTDSGNSLAAVEALVRWASSNEIDGQAVWQAGLTVGEALLGSLEDMATKEVPSPHIVELQRLLAKPQAHQQLLAMFCSLLKLTTSHRADCQQLRSFITQLLKLYRKQQLQRTLASSSSAVPQQFPGTAAAAAAATCVSGQHQASGTDTTGRLSTSSYRQWAALAGRVMLAEGQMMQQHDGIEFTAVADVAQRWLKVGRLLWNSHLFGKQSEKMKKEFKWLQLNVKQADRGMKEGQWRVSGKGSDLRAMIDMYKTCGQSTATGFPDHVLRARLKLQLLLRLQQCGAAICAALPVKSCCNNPACVNVTQLSEQQLVAGKGSRCSGCKVARYCSRECQLKHWKQHKKTCKRIRAQRTARPSSNVVPGPV